MIFETNLDIIGTDRMRRQRVTSKSVLSSYRITGCCTLIGPIRFNALGRSLRKHAYSNILKILPPKNENFRIKNSDI